MGKIFVFLIYMATALNVIWIAYILKHLFTGKKGRKKRIDFVRAYKKGNFTVAFIPYFFLHIAGALYTKTVIAGTSLDGSIFFENFFDSLAKTLLLAGLRFDTGSIQKYMDVWCFYKVSIYVAFSIVVFNATLFACSFLSQRFSFHKSTVRRLQRRRVKKNTCFIFGNNRRNVDVYNSDNDKEYPIKYIIDKFEDKGDDEFFSHGIKYANYYGEKSESEYLKRYLNCKAKDQKELVIIINFEDDAKNLSLCNSFLQEITSYHKDNEAFDPEDELKEKLEKVSSRLSKVSIYVFGDGTKDSLFCELESQGFGVIHYTNKYRYIGQRFLWNNPLVKYMDKRHIDYKKALLKPGVKATFALVGFGKMNRELFSNLVSGNQFASEDEKGKPVPVQMDYYLYDKNKNLFSKDLNYGYFRYEKFYNEITNEENEKTKKSKNNKNDYLPLAPLPANVVPIEDCDINSPEFFESLHNNLSSSCDKHLNFVFVSFGEDLDNAELAKKIAQLGKEWGIANLKVFVRMKHPMSNRSLVENADVCIYGDEDELYSLNIIQLKTFLKLGMLTDTAYQNISRENTGYENQSIKEVLLNRLWYAARYNIERISSCYSGINVKNMLGLMNLEISSSSSEGQLTEKEYNSIYQPKGADSVIRKNLMFVEHMRWNAFMICNGYIPSTKKQILKISGEGKKGKYHEERRHGNLTTFEGLDTFAQILTKKFGGDLKDYDVKKYDAMLMENCPTILGMIGMGIKKRPKTQGNK